VVEGVTAHFRHVLGHEHVEAAVSIEIAEADIAAGAEARRVEALPHDRAGLYLAQRLEGTIAIGGRRANRTGVGSAGRDSKSLKPCRAVRRQACLAGAQFDVIGLDDEPPVDEPAQTGACGLDLHRVGARGLVGKRRAVELAPR